MMSSRTDFCGRAYHTQTLLNQIRPRDYGDVSPRVEWSPGNGTV